MKKDWNIQGGMSVDMTECLFKTAYRAQGYKKGYSEVNSDDPGAYDFYNFTKDPDRRFVPTAHDETAYYMGFNPLAVFVETNRDFREASTRQPRPMPFSEKELQKIEIIGFTNIADLNLFDLNSSLALNRHNIRPYDPILTSLDYSLSSVFANEVYAEGYDGILFRTRQGITHAAVIWGRAKHKISCGKISTRTSALTMINSILDAEKLLGIKIDKEAD